MFWEKYLSKRIFGSQIFSLSNDEICYEPHFLGSIGVKGMKKTHQFDLMTWPVFSRKCSNTIYVSQHKQQCDLNICRAENFESLA